MTIGMGFMLLLTQIAVIATYMCAGWMLFHTKDLPPEDDLVFMPDALKVWLTRIMQKSFLGTVSAYGVTMLAICLYSVPTILLVILMLKTSFLRIMMCAIGWAMLFILSGHIAKKMTSHTALPCRIAGTTTITAIWIFFPSWFVLDIVGLLLVIAILAEYGSYFTFRSALLVSACVMAFDVVAVFASDFMRDFVIQSIGKIPNMLIIPDSPFHLHPQNGFSFGLGDIIFVGAIVMVAFRKAYEYKKRMLVVGTLVGYLVGSCLAIFMATAFDTMQPATIYLLPATIGAFIFTAWRCGVLSDICRLKTVNNNL